MVHRPWFDGATAISRADWDVKRGRPASFKPAQVIAGWTEALTFALCSHDETFGYMRRPDDGKSAAVIANPKTAEFQICRTTP